MIDRVKMHALLESQDFGKIYTTTVGVLSKILYGDEDAVNQGGTFVPEFGKMIKYRRVSTDTQLVLKPQRHQLVVHDSIGGVVADRFGPVLGARDSKKVRAYLDREGT